MKGLAHPQHAALAVDSGPPGVGRDAPRAYCMLQVRRTRAAQAESL